MLWNWTFEYIYLLINIVYYLLIQLTTFKRWVWNVRQVEMRFILLHLLRVGRWIFEQVLKWGSSFWRSLKSELRLGSIKTTVIGKTRPSLLLKNFSELTFRRCGDTNFLKLMPLNTTEKCAKAISEGFGERPERSPTVNNDSCSETCPNEHNIRDICQTPPATVMLVTGLGCWH